MAKKLISLLLTLAMLFTGLTVTASAATENTVNGAQYTVVRTEAELAAALQAKKNVMLANDIALTSTHFPQGEALTVYPGTILDGDGHTLTYSATRSAALFLFAAGTVSLKGTVNVRNVNFGTQAAPIVITGAEGLFTYAKDLSCEMVFENVNFYVGRTAVSANSGAIFAKLATIAHFRDCVLNVKMSNVTGGTLHGGWFGEVFAPGHVEMDNCTTVGTVAGRDGAAGFLAQNSSGAIEFNNCKNFANVTAPGFVAGFVANMGTGAVSTYATDCINYGNLTSTGTGYDAIAGGIFGRFSNRSTIPGWRLHVIYRCINYGKITAGATAGGILGRSHDHDYHGRTFMTLSGCENFGAVKGTQYAGGIVGVVAPTVYAAELTDCVNLGAVSSDGYAGNFAGLLSGGASIGQATVSDAIVNGGWAAGVVTGATGKTGVIAGKDSGAYTVAVGPYQGQSLNVRAPQYSNVTYFGSLTDIPAGVTKEGDLNALLEDLGERLGTEVVAADSTDKNTQVVLATPVLRGYQLGEIKDGKLSLRLAAGVYAKGAYSSLGFEVTITEEGFVSGTKTYQTQTVLTEIKETVGGQARNVNADSVAAKYLYTAVVPDLPTTGRVTLQITPVAVSRNGTKTYTGNTKTLAVTEGRVTHETMALNGALLDNFAIVYKRTNTMAEKTLATHLSKKISELTGMYVPVVKEYDSHNRLYSINVGRVDAAGSVPAGQNISVMPDSVSIVISGDTTAQLGEAVAYLIDVLAEKASTSSNSFYVTTPIVAPANTAISLMSFNMGAADDSNIKAAEWDLLLEYLPDIFTAQEPWAGFLDDFCNNHAVRPTTPFQASSADDDVMTTNVDNKAFTGNDYYGIYWGMPRWVPGGPNENQGKASYSVIFYAKDRFTVNEAKSGTFMFSNTPDVIGTKISKSSMPRCATYATLTDVNTGKEFVVVNVHLDHQNGQAEQAAILISELIRRVGKDTPMLITGDMNTNLTSSAIQHMINNSTMPLHAFEYLSSETYWSDNTKFGNIDWIFTNTPEKVDVTYYRFCNDFNLFYSRWTGTLQMYMPSDHPAIYVEFKFR